MAIIMEAEEIKQFKRLFKKFHSACTTGLDLSYQWVVDKEEYKALSVVQDVLDDIND